jgi:hypothetical protein
MNFVAAAERIYRERDLLGRIDKLLANPFRKSLGEDRIQLLQITFLHHMDLLAKAEEEWKLGPELLGECLDHFDQAGFRLGYCTDLEQIKQAEETLGLLADIDELLRPFASLYGEDGANTLHMSKGDDRPN